MPSVAALKHETLIDSCIGTSICNWVTRVHDTLPHRLRIGDWHRTIARMAPEVHPSHVSSLTFPSSFLSDLFPPSAQVLTRLSPNVSFPGEDAFNMDDLATPMESYLLQCAIPEGATLWPGLVANNKDFPGYVFDRFPTPLPGAAEDEEVIVFESPGKESPSTPARPSASSPALPLPPQSTRPQRTLVSLVPPVVSSPEISPIPCNYPHIHALGHVLSSPVSLPSSLANRRAPPLWNSFSPIKPLGLYHRPMSMAPATPSPCATMAAQSASLSHGLQDMASSIQDLHQALLTPGSGVGLRTLG